MILQNSVSVFEQFNEDSFTGGIMNYITYPPRSGKTQQMFEEFKIKC